MGTFRITTTALLAASLLLAGCATSPSSGGQSSQPLADSHFHIANYAMQGIPLKTLIDDYMGDSVQRSVVFGLPLQQKWDPYEDFADNRMAPNYYMGPDASMYFYSAIDDMVASDYASLSDEDKKRVDPLIVGFNPMDGYAIQHVERMLLMHPGTFEGIGEFSVHKELVEDKISDDAPTEKDGTLPPDARSSSPSTLYSPALDELLQFAAESGLAVSLHSDMYPAIVSTDGTSVEMQADKPYTQAMIDLCTRNPKATVIWAHTGLGRFVKPTADHLDRVKAILDACPNWSIDLSWDLVQKYMVAPEPGMPTTKQWTDFISTYQGRVLWGSDSVIFTKNKVDDEGQVVLGAPMKVKDYQGVAGILDPILSQLPPAAVDKVRWSNFARIFDKARTDVRAWEAAHADDSIWDLPAPTIDEP